ncbi:MAG: manganese efflux pump [Lachnospiraceae bacterium]|nr:manganese efflux pump [Lachnospiraceae bacterium]
MGIFELLLLSVGLAMDAFAVSICKGLSVKKLTLKESLVCGIWFGAFQGIMPFIGFIVGSGFEKWISMVAPWVAFILLTLIGINMIREAFTEEAGDEKEDFRVKTMFLMALATSIDALAVGITFVAVPVDVLKTGKLQNTIFAVIVIAVITFFISALGVKIGNLFGMRYRSGSVVLGGTILIFIGLYTLIGYLDTSDAMNDSDTVFGMLIPLIGTALGAAFVYAKKSRLSQKLRVLMAGASAGIMFSISIWGMIEPAAKGFHNNSSRAVIPLFICFLAGVALQYLIDSVVPHTHAFVDITEGPHSNLKAETKMMLAEVIHHIPEGIALGTIYAAHFMQTDWIPSSTSLFLAIAIAIQNFPEALFVSLPVMEKGTGKGKAFFMGIVSGVPVPLAAVFVLMIMILFPSALPYVMTMAGGAMIYTTIEELPLMAGERDNDSGAFAFVLGFSLIMLMIFSA